MDNYLKSINNQKKNIVNKDKKENRSKAIRIHLKPSEYKILHEGFSKSTLRKLSEYTRIILLNGPVTVYTRNKSYDEFVEEMAALKTTLNDIGSSFNQAVKKLQTMSHDQEIKAWALITEKSKEMFDKKVDEIELKVTQIAERWSQE